MAFLAVFFFPQCFERMALWIFMRGQAAVDYHKERLRLFEDEEVVRGLVS